MDIRKILLAVDGSEAANKAAGAAASLARLTGAQVLLFTCFPLLEGGEQPFVDPGGELPLREQAEKFFAVSRGLLGDAGVTFSAKHATGDPDQEIVALAEAEGCDLIVMGSRGLGKVMGLILGSVTKSVVQAAPCSVFVVR